MTLYVLRTSTSTLINEVNGPIIKFGFQIKNLFNIHIGIAAQLYYKEIKTTIVNHSKY